MDNKDIQAKKRTRDRLAVTILNDYGTQIYETVLHSYYETKNELRNLDKTADEYRYKEFYSKMERLSEITDLIMKYKDQKY